MRKFFHSKIFYFLLAILIATSVTALYRELAGTFKVKREIAKLEKQAAELESKNTNLKDMIDYLSSSAYQEKAARENLNLQAQGEIAVALPAITRSLQGAGSQKNEEANINNPSKWWRYFFSIR